MNRNVPTSSTVDGSYSVHGAVYPVNCTAVPVHAGKAKKDHSESRGRIEVSGRHHAAAAFTPGKENRYALPTE